MKACLTVILVIAGAFLYGCRDQADVRNQNKDVAEEASPVPPPPPGNTKRVTIAISDHPTESGQFIIEAAIPKQVFLRPGQMVLWTIVNNCRDAVVAEATIDGFTNQNPKGDHDPFGEEKSIFVVKDLKTEVTVLSPPAIPVAVGEQRKYDYKVSAKMAGELPDPILVDPVVIIGN